MPSPASARSRSGARLIGALCCAMVLAIGVAVAAPPTPQNCSDPDLGSRLKCKFDNIVAQQDATTDMLDSMSEIPDSQKQALRAHRDRSMQAFGRTVPGDFKELAKKKNPECQVAEIDNDGKGDDDGICKGGEDCLEVIGDQIGDDIQPCRRTGNPADREVCVEICDAEAVASNPDNFDESGRGRDLEDELDDTTAQYEVLNQMLEEVVALQSAPGEFLASGTGACSATVGGRPNGGVMWASLIAKLAMESIADVSDKFCNQDVLGNNAATACAVVVLLKVAAVDTWEVLDFIDGNVDSDTIDASFECLKEVNTSVGDGNAALESLETKVDGLDAQVKSLKQQLDEVKLLLTLPQGRRPGFPSRR